MPHTIHSHRWIGLALLAVAVSPGNSLAAAIYTDKNDFMSTLQSGYEEDFESPPFSLGSLGTNSQIISGNGFSYEITALSELWVAGYDGNSNQAMSTTDYRDTITIRFTSNNVRAVGGNFFIMDNFDFVAEQVSLTLSDGTTVNFLPTSPSIFRGFTTSGSTLITQLQISTPAPGQVYATLDNLVVGDPRATGGTVPEPTSLFLIGIGAAGLRAFSRKPGSGRERALFQP